MMSGYLIRCNRASGSLTRENLKGVTNPQRHKVCKKYKANHKTCLFLYLSH